MNEKIGQKQQIILPRRKPNWIRLSIFCIVFLISSTNVIWSFWRLGFNIFYSRITDISLITILSLISVVSGFSLIDTL
jgi:hypothetical protein